MHVFWRLFTYAWVFMLLFLRPGWHLKRLNIYICISLKGLCIVLPNFFRAGIQGSVHLQKIYCVANKLIKNNLVIKKLNYAKFIDQPYFQTKTVF